MYHILTYQYSNGRSKLCPNKTKYTLFNLNED
jgi:hypothetical protein